MRIQWTDPAVHDLTQICDYLDKQDRTATARRVAFSIYKGVDGLAEFPDIGRTGRKSGTRELVFGDLPYIAVYRVSPGIIEVLRILHGAQKWPQ